MARGSGKLMRAALKFLRRAERRARPGRMTPHARRHVFGGDVRPGKTKGSGYHYRPGGKDFPDRRIIPGTKRIDPSFSTPRGTVISAARARSVSFAVTTSTSPRFHRTSETGVPRRRACGSETPARSQAMSAS